MGLPNQYRQIRLTITEERGGFITAMLCAKPINAEWTKRHVVERQRFRMSDPPVTMHDALSLMYGWLEEYLNLHGQ